MLFQYQKIREKFVKFVAKTLICNSNWQATPNDRYSANSMSLYHKTDNKYSDDS